MIPKSCFILLLLMAGRLANAGLPPVTTTGQNYISAAPGNKITASPVNLSGSNVTGTLPNSATTGTATATASTLMARDASANTAINILTAGAGTVAACSLNGGTAGTGIYFPSASTMAIASGGAELGRWTTKGLSIGDVAAQSGLYVKQSLTSDTGIVLGNSSNATKLSIDYSGANGWGTGFVGGNYQTYMAGNSAGNTSIGWMSFGPGGSASMTPPWPIEFATASIDGGVTALSAYTPLKGATVNGLPVVVMRNKSATVNTLAAYGTAGSSGNLMGGFFTRHVVQTGGSEQSQLGLFTQNAGTPTEWFTLGSTGLLKLPAYGVGAISSDASGNLSSGLLATTNGGTGQNSTATFPTSGTVPSFTPTNHGVVISGTSNAANVTGAGTAGQVMTSNGASSDPTFQAAPTSTQVNYLVNPGFEYDTSDWTTTVGSITRTTNSTIVGSGVGAGSWTTSGAGTVLSTGYTLINVANRPLNWAASCRFRTGVSSHTFQVYDGTGVINSVAVPSNSTGTYTRATINFVTPASAQARIQITSGASDTVNIDDCYLGPADTFNISQVSQAQILGTVTWPATASCTWSTTATTFADYAAVAACTLPTGANITGSASAPATKIPGITFSSISPGDLMIVVNGGAYANNGASSTGTQYQISDGTNTSEPAQAQAGASSIAGAGSYVFRMPYTTAQSNVTLRVQGKVGNAVNTAYVDTTAIPLTIKVYFFPSQSQLAVSSNQQTLPTVQTFTSGSGTYTKPAGVSYIRVRAVGGGGGGGGGSHTTAAGAGGNGGNTTFGTALLTANGGAGGGAASPNGGLGGTASLGTGPIGTALPGGMGTGSGQSSTASSYSPGGMGGSTIFGGAGSGGGAALAGSSGVVNTGGGGGGGAGASAPTTSQSGAGGGAGGFVDALISGGTLAATFPYAVGAGGASGNLGTTGDGAGGAGGSGYIEVTEYYGAFNAPLLVGSVTSNTSGMERVERATISEVANCTITRQSGSWISGTTYNSAGDCTLTLAAGIFSAAPTCTVVSDQVANRILNAITATSVPNIQTFNSALASTDASKINIICMGPR